MEKSTTSELIEQIESKIQKILSCRADHPELVQNILIQALRELAKKGWIKQ